MNEQNRGRAQRRPEAVRRNPTGQNPGNFGSVSYGSTLSGASPARGGQTPPPRGGDIRNASGAQTTRPPSTSGQAGAERTTAQGRRTAARTVHASTGGKGPGGSANSFRTVPQSRAMVDVKRQQRALKAAEAERIWQKDIVRVKGGVDKVMLTIIMLLVAFGCIMIFSASYPVAVAKGLDSFYYAKRHVVFVLIGSVVMLGASFFPYRLYKTWAPFVAYGGSLLLLALVLLVGVSEGEAQRWIQLPGGLTLQPSELMKVSIVLMLAWYIEKYRAQIDARLDRKSMLLYNMWIPGAFMAVACVMILAEKHLSGTLIVAAVSYMVVIVGGCHFGWTTLFYGVCGVAAGGLFLLKNPYALKRILTFVDDNADMLGEDFQTTQGVYAIGSGGLFGLGFGQSRQKYSYVGAAHTDFIFSIWCEELGFIGGVVLVLLFLAFLWRGYVIASRAPDTFSMLTAFGITTQVGIQAFLNMCVASDIIPNTGISLPFFSYGGTSLVVLMAEMGLLLSISRQYYCKKSDLQRSGAHRGTDDTFEV